MRATEVKVTLVECKRFPGKDPYVKFFCPASSEVVIYESTVKRNNTNPRWNETFSFRVSAGDEIRVACMDQKGGADAFLGNLIINPDDEGVKVLPLLNSLFTFIVERAKQKSAVFASATQLRQSALEMKSPRVVLSLKGIYTNCDGATEAICRVLYAGMVVSEVVSQLNRLISPAQEFSIDCVGGNLACELSLWRAAPKDSQPFATCVVDLRHIGFHRINAETCAQPTAIDVDVRTVDDTKLKDGLICINRLHHSSVWMIRLPQQGWMSSKLPSHCRSLFALGAIGEEFEIEFLEVEGCTTRVVAKVICQTSDTVQHYDIRDGNVAIGEFECYCWWSTCSIERVQLPETNVSCCPPSEVIHRSGQTCAANLEFVSLIVGGENCTKHFQGSAPLQGRLSVSFGALIEMEIASMCDLPFTNLNKNVSVAVDETSQVCLVSFFVSGCDAIAFGQLNPFHMSTTGRSWIPLHIGDEQVGAVEIEWSNLFFSKEKPLSRCFLAQQWKSLTIEIVEARSLMSADLGGSCDAYCAVQLLPLQEIEHQLTTTVVKNSRCPVWEGCFTVALDSQVEGLVVLVMDSDASGDNRIGVVTISATDSFVWQRQTGDCWFPLDCPDVNPSEVRASRGSIRLRWSFTAHGNAATSLVEALRAKSCCMHISSVVSNFTFVQQRRVALRLTVEDFYLHLEGEFSKGSPVPAFCIPQNAFPQDVIQRCAVQPNPTIGVAAEIDGVAALQGSFSLKSICSEKAMIIVDLHPILDLEGTLVLFPPPSISINLQLVYAPSTALRWIQTESNDLWLRLSELRVFSDRCITELELHVDEPQHIFSTAKVIASCESGKAHLDWELKGSLNKSFTSLCIEVAVREQAESSNHFTLLGKVVLDPLRIFDDQEGVTWVPVVQETHIVGVVEVYYRHNFMNVMATTNESRLALTDNHVTVAIIQGRRLRVVDSSSLPRAQVVVGLGDSAFSTRAAASSSAPSFHEGAILRVPDDVKDAHLRIQVIDALSFRVIGTASLPILELICPQSVRRWVTLTSSDSNSGDGGELLLETKGVVRGFNGEVLETEDAGPSSDFMEVTVDCASGLLSKTIHESLATDTMLYVKLKYISVAGEALFEQSTEDVPGGCSPVFAESMVLPFVPRANLHAFVVNKLDGLCLGSCIMSAQSLLSALSAPSEIKLTLMNCTESGDPSQLVTETQLAFPDMTLGSLTLHVKRHRVSKTLMKPNSMLMDVCPHFVRLTKLAREASHVVMSYSPSFGRKATASFAVCGDEHQKMFRPNNRRLCVQNPSLVTVSVTDNRGLEVGRCSFVASHSLTNNDDKRSQEVWAPLYGKSESEGGSINSEVGKILLSTTVIVDAAQGSQLARDVYRLNFRGISGLCVGEHTRCTLLLRTVFPSLPQWYHETRRFRAPTAVVGRMLSGRCFSLSLPAIPFDIEQTQRSATIGVYACLNDAAPTLIGSSRVTLPAFGADSDAPLDSTTTNWVAVRDSHAPASSTGEGQLKTATDSLLNDSRLGVNDESESTAASIGFLNVSIAARREWQSGTLLTVVRFVPSSPAAAAAIPMQTALQLHLRCGDQRTVLYRVHCSLRGGIGERNSSSGYCWSIASLPPDAIAVESLQMFSLHSDGSNVLLGSSSSVGVLWTLDHLSSTAIDLFDGGVKLPFALLLSNELAPTLNADLRCTSRVLLTIEPKHLAVERFACRTEILDGSIASLRARAVGQSEVIWTSNCSVTDKTDFNFLKQSPLSVSRSCSSFHKTALRMSVKHDAFAEPMMVSLTAQDLISVRGTVVLDVRGQSGSVLGHLTVTYSLSFTDAEAGAATRHQRHQDALAGGTSNASQQISIAAFPTRCVNLLLPHHRGINGTGENDGATAVRLLAEIWCGNTRILSSKAHTTEGQCNVVFDKTSAASGEGTKRIFLSEASRRGFSVTVWQIINEHEKKVAFVGNGRIGSDVVSQHHWSGAQRVNDEVAVSIYSRAGAPTGVLWVRVMDCLTYDINILNKCCVFGEVIEMKTNADFFASSTADLVVRQRKSDREGHTAAASIALNAQGCPATDCFTLGPFSTLDDAVLELVLMSKGESVSEPCILEIPWLLRENATNEVACPEMINGEFRLVGIRGGSTPGQVLLTVTLRALITGTGEQMGGDVLVKNKKDAHRRETATCIDQNTSLQMQATSVVCRSPSRPKKSRKDSHKQRLVSCAVVQAPDAMCASTFGHRAVCVNNRCILFGGLDKTENYVGSIRTFDLSEVKWKSWDPAKHASAQRARQLQRDGHASAVCGEVVILDGGYGPGGLDVSLGGVTGTYEDVNAVYHITSNSNSNNNNNNNNNNATMKEHIAPAGYLDTTVLFDPRALSWKVVPTQGNAKEPRADHTLVRITDNLLLAFGGYGLEIVERVEMATSAADQVIVVAADDERVAGAGLRKRRPKKQRSYEACEILYNDLRCLNMETMEWSTIYSTTDVAQEKLQDGVSCVSRPPPVASHTAEVVGRCMYVFGGLVNCCDAAGEAPRARGVAHVAPSNHLYSLNIDSLSWFEHKPPSASRSGGGVEWPTSRYGHASCFSPSGGVNGSMLIYGGEGTGMSFDELLWRYVPDTARFERIVLHHSVPLLPRWRSAIGLLRPHNANDSQGVVDKLPEVFIISGGCCITHSTESAVHEESQQNKKGVVAASGMPGMRQFTMSEVSTHEVCHSLVMTLEM